MSEIIKLNNRNYIFSCILICGTPEREEGIASAIPYGNIQYLEIVDNIYCPFVNIKMMVKTTRNSPEKLPTEFKFKFTANSRNLVLLSLSPEDNQFETFSMMGVIDDSVVLSSDSDVSSTTLFSIIDTKEAALKEIKASSVYPRVDPSLTISENIKEILKKGIGTEDAEKAFDKQNFSLGTDGGLKIDYTFPLHYTLFDALCFLLKYNVSRVNGLYSQFFLRWNHDTQQYENYSVFDLFNNANLVQSNIEGFTLGNPKSRISTSLSNNESEAILTTGTVFVPPGNQLHNITFSNVNFSISNQEFLSIYCSQTNNIDNTNILSKVDLVEKLNEFNTKILNCEAMKKVYDANTLGKIVPNIDLDAGKNSAINYRMLILPFDTSISVPVAEAQMYNSFIFQNMTMSFKCDGGLYRDPGHFIVMTKVSDIGGSFDEKLLGQWLVTEVCHKFDRGIYSNTFQCAKPFRINT